MKKPRIFTYGETVLDILFKNGQAFSSTPGGAMLNTAVSLGRIGEEVFLISEAGDDLCGGFITDFLKQNNVKTDFFAIRNDIKTALAIASLDENNEAAYNFYISKQPPTNRKIPDFSVGDLLLFGSFYSLREENRENVARIVTAAKKAGALIVYDPNIRTAHCPLSQREQANLLENIAWADIVRASDEDIWNVFDIQNGREAFARLKEFGAKNLFYTSGRDGVWFFNKTSEIFSPSKSIVPVSTIGAGDTFNAGILTGIARNIKTGESLKDFLSENAPKIMELAVEMATETCLSMENYVAGS